MISKADIIKMAKHVTRRSAGMPDRAMMHPRREWLLGLSCAFVVMGAGAAYNAFVFQHYSTIESFVTETQVHITEYRSDRTQTVLERYRERTAAYEALRAEIPAVSTSAADTSTTSTTSGEASDTGVETTVVMPVMQ